MSPKKEMLDAGYWILDVSYIMTSIQHLASSIQHLASSIQHLVEYWSKFSSFSIENYHLEEPVFELAWRGMIFGKLGYGLS